MSLSPKHATTHKSKENTKQNITETFWLADVVTTLLYSIIDTLYKCVVYVETSHKVYIIHMILRGGLKPTEM